MKIDLSTADVIKFAAKLLTWLVMGFWMTAKITSGYVGMQKDIATLTSQVNKMNEKLDGHIEQQFLKMGDLKK